MATAIFGNPILRVDESAALSLVIESEWSPRFQHFLTLRRIPSFVESAGTRIEDRVCDVLVLARGIAPERVEGAIAEWQAALGNDRGARSADAPR